MAAVPSIDALIAQAASFRHAQKMEESLELYVRAGKQVGSDPRVAFGLAQTSYECWRPAADLFATARRLIPNEPDLVRNHALALAAEGQIDAAEAMLDAVIETNPLWIDGHRTLANLRTMFGTRVSADASFHRACEQKPDSVDLRLAWFYHHAIAKNWKRAEAVLEAAPFAMPVTDRVEMARLFLRSESGDPQLSAAEFERFSARRDPGFDLCHIRYLLRNGLVSQAIDIASRHVEGPQARSFWPYLSLCWRLIDDPRADWIDNHGLFVALIDDIIPADELDSLTNILRRLHQMSAPYPEQSVRGGTQTARQLFFNPDPAIQKLRQRVRRAVCDYIENLPDIEAGHPLLSSKTGIPLFAGSWSVRLTDAGHHSSHTHVQGWISSALYVALPEVMGGPPAGELALGMPPPELQTGLAPYRHVQPRVGRLILFPSTMWHATVPFESGERLSVAFDVAIPAATA